MTNTTPTSDQAWKYIKISFKECLAFRFCLCTLQQKAVKKKAPDIISFFWSNQSAKKSIVKNKITLELKQHPGVPVVAQWLTNPTRNHEVVGSIPDLLSGLRIQHCRELWSRLQMWLGSCVAVSLA